MNGNSLPKKAARRLKPLPPCATVKNESKVINDCSPHEYKDVAPSPNRKSEITSENEATLDANFPDLKQRSDHSKGTETFVGSSSRPPLKVQPSTHKVNATQPSNAQASVDGRLSWLTTNALIQQKLPACQLVYDYTCVVGTLICVSIVFTVVGAVCLTREATDQLQITYSDINSRASLCDDISDIPCTVHFVLNRRMKGPIFLHYTLTNFFQNHRKYVESVHQEQLFGQFGFESPGSDVVGFRSCRPHEYYMVGAKRIYHYPCGLVARSIFNDTFSLHGPSGVVNFSKDGIVSRYDTTYKSKDESWLRENCFSLTSSNGFPSSLKDFNGTGNISTSRYNCWHYVSDEDLSVWMNIGAGSNVRKLKRTFSGDLTEGNYSMIIDVKFPVSGFGGTKGFVISNSASSDNDLHVVAVIYLVVGIMSFVMALIFTTHKLVSNAPGQPPPPRPKNVSLGPARPALHSGNKSSLRQANLRFFGQGRVSAQERLVQCPNMHNDNSFPTNFVSTTKYTALNFLPRNLMLQFQRFANMYFLSIAVLASISIISPMSGTTFWFPLIVVLGFTAVKDAHEDYVRHTSDLEENRRYTEVYNTLARTFERVPWKDVTVGSLVRVSTDNNDCSPLVPCDLVLLATSYEEGTCFLETVNLDGETNLKMRRAVEKTHRLLTTSGVGQDVRNLTLKVRDLTDFVVEVRCGHPDHLLYDFNGYLRMRETKIPLTGGSSGGQLLQRSTKLKNTKWCLGIAVYTGKETKIQMNMTEPPNKRSNVEGRLNLFILRLFGALFLICTLGAIGSGIWVSDMRNAWYLDPDTPTAVTFDFSRPGSSSALTFFSFLILLSMTIPISLYVSLELVKGVTALIISCDRSMHDLLEGVASSARSAGLCEELGQVSFIFSDKTGTLTQNMMNFKKCSIAGVEYGRGHTEVERSMAHRNSRCLPDEPLPQVGDDPDFRFHDERLTGGRWRDAARADVIESFLLNLALNHTVQVDYDASDPNASVQYQAESPDEECFVSAAKNLGFFFCKRVMKEVTVRCFYPTVGKSSEPVDTVWTILNTNPFDNYRKRSSVVVRGTDGSLFLLVKGADTSVLPFVDGDRCPYMKETMQQINRFGNQGLRTLVFAGRRLSPHEYTSWAADVAAASLVMEGRDELLRQLAARIEENLTEPNHDSALVDASAPYQKSLQLTGVTALEDKLQENVGHCLAQLAKAMIKIWMLTGDKLETAVNVAFATDLLNSAMQPLLQICKEEVMHFGTEWKAKAIGLELNLVQAMQVCKTKSAEKLANTLKTMIQERERAVGSIHTRCLASILSLLTEMSSGEGHVDFALIENRLNDAFLQTRVGSMLKEFDKEVSNARDGGYALVIDGPSLQAALSDDNISKFLSVVIRCKAVVCCRVTPRQKAQVTQLVRDHLQGHITLAIGDGANDVSMIQAAHIGVGIRGKEGQQAALASDYALAQFCFLERLLLVHGRWSYNRISTMVCYFFYKNITFAMTLFWFCLTNAFSAQSLFDDAYLSLFNLMFTSLPVMAFALLDRDIEPDVVASFPQLYCSGQENTSFTPFRFGLFVGGAGAHSLLLFFVTWNTFNVERMGLYSGGTVVLTCVITCVTAVMALHTSSWTAIHGAVYLGSMLLWMLFLLVYHAVPAHTVVALKGSQWVYGVIYQLCPTGIFWLTIAGLVAMVCLPIVCYKYAAQTLTPSLADYCRRIPRPVPTIATLRPSMCDKTCIAIAVCGTSLGLLMLVVAVAAALLFL